MNHNIRLIFTAVLLFVTMLSTTIQAQDNKMLNVMFPDRTILQQYTFDPVPVLIKVDRNVSDKNAFHIPIPSKEWQRIPEKELESGTKILAGFIHPKGPDQGMIQVMQYHPPYEMGPSDWLLFTLEKENMKVITSAGEGGEEPGPYFEALAVSSLPKGSSEEPVMMRAAVFRHGDTFVLVRCMASSKAYLEQAYYFGMAIHRFEFLNPQSPITLGKWKNQCIGNYCFTGPESEYAASDREAIWELSLPLTLEKSRTGVLYINVFSGPLAEKTSAKARVNRVINRMVDKGGMSFNEEMVALKGEHKNLGGTSYYARNKGVGSDKTAIEFFALSWEGEGSAVLIYMLTDAREKNPVAWMVNKRTFEIISQSISRKVD
jgi:hypothetical protein